MTERSTAHPAPTPAVPAPTTVIIGNFDGVHLGHQQLLRAAADLGRPVTVVTFWPHPRSVLTPDNAPLLLTGLDDRVELVKRYSNATVRITPFTREFANWEPARFIESVLLPLNPATVVVGENFTFGRGAQGTPATLAADGRFEVLVIPLVEIQAARASSSRIRDLLGEGDVETAATLLGRDWRVRGVVMVGDQRGRTLGFPTANIAIPEDMVEPADGVYAGWVRLLDDGPDSPPLAAAISVGSNPTFAAQQRRIEAHVIGRDDLELYGANIAVDFVAHLRGMVRFACVDDLKSQLAQDVTHATTLLAEAVGRE
ncbi:MAG: bifunctional riboflavin kinase/FAD synthetase [Propionibacteriaceae bacterium]|jgi:riboflavin kinase/FMN adenylyltransferase|nr:bifunctional riboflavin kinase/FAD synthetase [Propionibacteriaceae bacterium]